MKISKVIPIFKSGDTESIDNYRPISLLLTLSKVLERLVFNRLYKYLSVNHLIVKEQFGFRPKHSTELALIHATELLNSFLEDRLFSLAIYIDLSKAFDALDHDILLHKLYVYGVRGHVLKVDNSPIVPSDKVKNLGVIFDRHMVMDRFVSLKCKSASFQLHSLGKIRQYLDTTTAKKLVQALVLCHLDYCNSLLYNMPDSQLGKLQLIQNSAARLITGTKKYSPITPVLQQLHWLPVKSRISFKILLLTFQCLHNMAPSYLQELLNKYTPTRNLRSSQKNLLECPVLGTRFYGERTFSFGGPLLWNAVPLHLKEANSVNNFKSLLKTFLFQEYYN